MALGNHLLHVLLVAAIFHQHRQRLPICHEVATCRSIRTMSLLDQLNVLASTQIGWTILAQCLQLLLRMPCLAQAINHRLAAQVRQNVVTPFSWNITKHPQLFNIRFLTGDGRTLDADWRGAAGLAGLQYEVDERGAAEPLGPAAALVRVRVELGGPGG